MTILHEPKLMSFIRIDSMTRILILYILFYFIFYLFKTHLFVFIQLKNIKIK